MLNNKNTGDYEVGHGRPPKKGQYQKGNSGNPSGRPKKQKSSNEIFYAQMHREHICKENGEEKSITRIELIFNTMFKQALAGNIAYMNLYLSYANAAEAEIRARRFDPMEMVLNPYEEDYEEEQDTTKSRRPDSYRINMVETLLKEAKRQGKPPEELLKNLSLDKTKLKKARLR